MTRLTLSTFHAVPDFAKGLVRDIRVRWVLEELGDSYTTAPMAFDERNSAGYRAMNPFGQVPVIRHDGSAMFESGAILFALAERTSLVPANVAGRYATLSWMFAALNTVEPNIALLFANDHARADQQWAQLAREDVTAAVEQRLGDLARHLDGRTYLLDDFTVADILMVTVLRFLQHTDLLTHFPVVDAYVARCQQRTAFRRALAAQMDDLDRPVAA